MMLLSLTILGFLSSMCMLIFSPPHIFSMLVALEIMSLVLFVLLNVVLPPSFSGGSIFSLLFLCIIVAETSFGLCIIVASSRTKSGLYTQSHSFL